MSTHGGRPLSALVVEAEPDYACRSRRSPTRGRWPRLTSLVHGDAVPDGAVGIRPHVAPVAVGWVGAPRLAILNAAIRGFRHHAPSSRFPHRSRVANRSLRYRWRVVRVIPESPQLTAIHHDRLAIYVRRVVGREKRNDARLLLR
jgi:hypothetical protein